jgi:hypothetical protein
MNGGSCLNEYLRLLGGAYSTTVFFHLNLAARQEGNLVVNFSAMDVSAHQDVHSYSIPWRGAYGFLETVLAKLLRKREHSTLHSGSIAVEHAYVSFHERMMVTIHLLTRVPLS